MYVAQHAWHAANIPRMQEVLDRYNDLQQDDDPRSFMWHYLTALIQQVNSTPSLYQGNPSMIQFSTDNRLIVVDENNIISIDLDSGQQQKLPRQPRIVYEAAFSPDGRLVATASYDRAVKLWDLATGTMKYHLRGQTTRANSVAFTPDGKTLASSSMDTTVKLWQVATGEEIGTFENDENVTCLAFSPNGKTLAAKGEGGRITLWGQ